MSIKPLAGIKVLDFSKVLAGPLCSQGLADLGAEVIKIEDCSRGDDTRGWPPFREGDGAVFVYANRRKRSLALNLKTPEAQAIIRKLVKAANIVMESYGPDVPEKLHIDYDSLKAVKPDLIYCSVSGFGRTGPLSHGKGYDMILQAFTGMVSIMGEPDSGPVRAPYSPVDQGTGMHALSAILAALLHKRNTGEGCRIDVSLFDTGVAFLGYMMQSYWEKGAEPKRFGCAHESLCPYQNFMAADKPILIGVASEPLWQRFCAAVGHPEMASDPRFRTNADRVRNRNVVIATVQAIIGQRSSEEWVEKLTGEGIPCTQINTFKEVLTHPHTLASGLILDYESPNYGKLQSIGQPVKFNGQRADAGSAAPRHAQHTEEILRELGMDDDAITALEKTGAISRTGKDSEQRQS